MAEPALLDTITAAGLEHAGRVTLVASHGALHVAALASRARLRAVILSDAGIGLDRAGVAGVEALGAIGMAAAAADVRSARIGDAADMRARGRLSLVNGPAAALGCASGDAVHEALVLLAGAPEPQGRLDDPSGGRAEIALLGGGAVLLDSASLMEPEDAGRIVVTGSHGGVVGRGAGLPLPARPAFAAFNDAGLGVCDAGVSRLPRLDAEGVPAVAVSHWTALIGDGRSTWTGIVSVRNAAARALGFEVGLRLDWQITRLLSAAS